MTSASSPAPSGHERATPSETDNAAGPRAHNTKGGATAAGGSRYTLVPRPPRA